MQRFGGKVVAITGSGSGLGREVARMVAAEGGSVVVSDVVEQRAMEAADLIESEGGAVAPVRADVRSQSDMERLVDCAAQTFGRLDAMHANAGVHEFGLGILGEPHLLSAEDWDAIMNVNGRGIFLAFRAAVTHMVGAGGGTLLATTSASGSFIYPSCALYAASKFAANGITKAFAVAYGSYGIRANAMAPFHGMSPNLLLPPDAPVIGKSYEEMSPWRATGNPGAMPLALPEPPTLRDNANLALFLLSDDSRYISGEVIHSASGGTGARVAIDFAAAGGGDVLPEEARQQLNALDP